MQLYNTQTQTYVSPHFAKTIRLYVCGITPYDSAHLGHAFVYTHFDVLVRHLQAKGHDVIYVRNVTDLDDDTLRTAKKRDVHFQVLARSENASFEANLTRLGLLAPTHNPFVTDNVDAIIPFVQGLLDANVAYALPDHRVYMDSTNSKFLQFSQYSKEHALELFTERGGDPDAPGKKNKLDFLLWQPSAPDEPAWATPWGEGRPGWHIECSVLVNEYLGGTIDIHGGGTDLIFPHHEAEVLQSESLTNQTPFANVWMHTGMVGLEGVKMSKSLGNLVFLTDLLEKHCPDCVRYLLLSHHYRDDWTYTPQKMADAAEMVAVWKGLAGSDPVELQTAHSTGEGTGNTVDLGGIYVDQNCNVYTDRDMEIVAEVDAHLDNDLDTPAALAVISREAKRGNLVSARLAAKRLGFFQEGLL